ncbi:serine/threonine protein phosphatase PrpC [Anaerobacterium chartisolvens]|uniref:Serine/threonine protein phosphatase PrpC n=1 Tax=Anaerobacterium chartisolvens TaxID=1297424 RepID=A0A369B4K9_9FIRM|nr:PP2C family serine/threonine-protein phosphatase [Anaerobacterium chartisolvens]RCX15487.1 serine/threonine protein phosphatase PrpC [Anaerobacterium chartisolvens]
MEVNENKSSGVLETSDFAVFATRVTGFSHIKAGKNCQDAFLCTLKDIEGKEVIIASVADGHGSVRHDLSEYGSGLAVKAANELLEEMLVQSGEDIHVLYKSINAEFPKNLLKRWKENVIRDFSERFPEQPLDDTPQILKRYGTTLLFCVVVDDIAVYGRLGDGNIVIISGNDVQMGLKADDLLGTETYSLCQQMRSLSRWQIKVCYNFDFAVLSTDGFIDSFNEDEEAFNNAVLKLKEYIVLYGPQAALDSLPVFLSRCTNYGSGDDITVSCIYKKVLTGGEQQC